jgi:hypothetical protein
VEVEASAAGEPEAEAEAESDVSEPAEVAGQAEPAVTGDESDQ